jgi:arginine decarboxylase
MTTTLQTIMAVCAEEGVPVPDLIIESGRYLVEDHAFRLFSIVKRKGALDGVPFYLIDGSIMSTFPDAWALHEQFTVLPINHWESPFVRARLAGLTCDRDDVYPTHGMEGITLELPEDAENLIVGFFDCGAYQETLGGRRGTKHCMLPEGAEMILDEDENGELFIEQYFPAQTAFEVLDNLGYRPEPVAIPFAALQVAGR